MTLVYYPILLSKIRSRSAGRSLTFLCVVLYEILHSTQFNDSRISRTTVIVQQLKLVRDFTVLDITRHYAEAIDGLRGENLTIIHSII
jgi:hypothetical protein